MLDSYSFEDYSADAESTAIYPEKGTGSVSALCYLGLGLGEAGEIQGKIKKILRDDADVVSPERAQAILDECGDQLWYLDRLTAELGSSLREVAYRNAEKLDDRRRRNALQGSGDTR